MSAFVHGQNQHFTNTGNQPSPASKTFFPPKNSAFASSPYEVEVVARRIAKSMLGRAVTIRVAGGETIHGIVTDVLAGRRKPRIIVGGLEYPVTQVLTAAPPEVVTTGAVSVST